MRNLAVWVIALTLLIMNVDYVEIGLGKMHNRALQTYVTYATDLPYKFESVVSIHNQDGSYGSGFVVAATDSGVLVATNHHVISPKLGTPKDTLWVQTRSADLHVAEIVIHSKGTDLAILEVKGLRLAPLVMSHEKVMPGEIIVLLGNPEFEWERLIVGEFERLYPLRTQGPTAVDMITMAFDLYAGGGSSGSPIFNLRGEVVAIHARGGRGQAFDIPVEHLEELLEKYRNKELADDVSP